jgi:hypothetical protein
MVLKEDSIVPAPGKQNGMMVESKTGKRPHLVCKQKGGKFVYDEGCRMFLSANFCAHTVAVAEKMHMLPQFILWRQKSQKHVNLARIVLNDAPKGAGKKGGKATSKRYGVPKKDSNSITTTTIDPFTAPQASTSSSPQGLTPFEGTGFFFKWVTRRITVCQGKCGRPMRTQNGSLFSPPYDLCIARKEQRSYCKNGQKHLGRVRDSHYHFKKSCVPDASSIEVPGDVRARWGKNHRTQLENEFGQKEQK